MERKTNRTLTLIAAVLLLSLSNMYAHQPSDCKCNFYQAYIEGNMEEWPVIIENSLNAYTQTGNVQFLEEFLTGTYGYIPYLIDYEQDKRAKQYIDRARDAIQVLEQEKPNSSYDSFKGALIAFEIAMEMYKAVYLGPKSMAYIQTALKSQPESPYAWLEMGNAEYHMPRMFGGSYEAAIDHYKNSIRYFERKPQTQCDWLYLNTLTWLAKSYDKAGQEILARQTYKKILQLAPDFQWVKEELYPQFLQNLATEKS